MRAYIDETLVGTVQALRSFRLDCAIGSSGTIENCTEIAFRLFHPKESQERKNILGRNDLRKLIALMCPMTTEERRKIPGMNPDRADIIVGGAAILELLMDSMGIDEIHASERGLRDGLLIDFLKREEDSFPIHAMSVRRMSVLRLARLFRVDEAHANTTATRALALLTAGKRPGSTAWMTAEGRLSNMQHFYTMWGVISPITTTNIIPGTSSGMETCSGFSNRKLR